MSGAPKARCTLRCLRGERELLGKEPFGARQKASRLKHLVVPAATVPALAGMAAAVCLVRQAQADPRLPTRRQPAATRTATTVDALSDAADPRPSCSPWCGDQRQPLPCWATPAAWVTRSRDRGEVHHKQNGWTVLECANCWHLDRLGERDRRGAGAEDPAPPRSWRPSQRVGAPARPAPACASKRASDRCAAGRYASCAKTRAAVNSKVMNSSGMMLGSVQLVDLAAYGGRTATSARRACPTRTGCPASDGAGRPVELVLRRLLDGDAAAPPRACGRGTDPERPGLLDGVVLATSRPDRGRSRAGAPGGRAGQLAA